MSADKPTRAKRLAGRLDFWARAGFCDQEAAAELRRLDESEAALIEALEYVIRGVPDTWEGVQKARAAIARAKEARNG